MPLNIANSLTILQTKSWLAVLPDLSYFWELLMALKTGMNVVSMNTRVISQLPSMHTPTVQNMMNASLIHRTMNRQTLLMLSSMLRIAEATSMESCVFLEVTRLTRRPVVRQNIEPRSSIEVQLFSLGMREVARTHLCMARSVRMNMGQVETQVCSDSIRYKSLTVPFS